MATTALLIIDVQRALVTPPQGVSGGTDLLARLQARAVGTVVVVGIQSEMCVSATRCCSHMWTTWTGANPDGPSNGPNEPQPTHFTRAVRTIEWVRSVRRRLVVA